MQYKYILNTKTHNVYGLACCWENRLYSTSCFFIISSSFSVQTSLKSWTSCISVSNSSMLAFTVSYPGPARMASSSVGENERICYDQIIVIILIYIYSAQCAIWICPHAHNNLYWRTNTRLTAEYPSLEVGAVGGQG